VNTRLLRQRRAVQRSVHCSHVWRSERVRKLHTTRTSRERQALARRCANSRRCTDTHLASVRHIQRVGCSDVVRLFWRRVTGGDGCYTTHHHQHILFHVTVTVTISPNKLQPTHQEPGRRERMRMAVSVPRRPQRATPQAAPTHTTRNDTKRPRDHTR
jgi:hypothetical protein